MRRKRIEAAEKIAANLVPAEAAIDAALRHTADLSNAILDGRISTGVSARVGHPALEEVGHAFQLIMQARSRIVAAHDRLAETQVQMGLREVAFGGLGDKPSEGVPKGGLALVDRAA